MLVGQKKLWKLFGSWKALSRSPLGFHNILQQQEILGLTLFVQVFNVSKNVLNFIFGAL